MAVIFHNSSSYTYITNCYINHIDFYLTQYYKKTTNISQQKNQVYKYQFSSIKYKKDYCQFYSNKINHRNTAKHLPPQKIPYVISINKRIAFSTWAMSIYQSVYMWDNVDMIIQRIDSLIVFDSKTTDLYDSQYFSK